MAADRMEEYVMFIAMLIFHRDITCLVLVSLHQLKCHSEQCIILTSQQMTLTRYNKPLGALVKLSFFRHLL